MSTARARVRLRPATATAPVRPASQPAPAARPDLRLVRPGELTPQVRRRRAAAAGVVAAALLFLCLFALVAFQAVLAQNQMRLDRLEDDVEEQQARYQRLRLRVAELESPGRIVSAAQQLGMVPPPGVTYLSPSGAVADELSRDDRPAGGTPAPDEGSDGNARTSGPWAAVKPYLGGG